MTQASVRIKYQSLSLFDFDDLHLPETDVRGVCPDSCRRTKIHFFGRIEVPKRRWGKDGPHRSRGCAGGQ